MFNKNNNNNNNNNNNKLLLLLLLLTLILIIITINRIISLSDLTNNLRANSVLYEEGKP